MVRNPQNRIEAIQPVVEKLGGTIEGGWLAFGDYDVILICQLPDNVSAAAFAMAGSAGGALKAVKTTPLMTIDEAMEAMRAAAAAEYRPPRKVRINLANSYELMELPGVGPAEARTIVAHRSRHGPISDAGELAKILSRSPAPDGLWDQVDYEPAETTAPEAPGA